MAASQRLFSATSERVCSQSVRQDLDEAQEVIARGDPIVSLSVGAAADFAYGPTRFDFDEDGQPQATEATEGVAPPTTVRLESGDLLVFGGNPHDCRHLGCILPRVAFSNDRAHREVAAGISRCGGLRPGAGAELAAHGAGAAELYVQEHGARDGGADARLTGERRSKREVSAGAFGIHQSGSILIIVK